MRIRFNPRWLLISALLFSLQFCRAQVVTPPPLSFDLGTVTGTQLWDLTGAYTLNLTVSQNNGVQVPLNLVFSMVHDGRGNLSGPTNDLQTLILADNNFFPVFYVVKGKVTGFNGTARARFTIRLISAGPGDVGGLQVQNFGGTITVDAETDSETQELVGSAKINANFGSFGTLRGPIDFSTALPSGVDGTWTLSMQFLALNKVGGTASVIMPNDTFGLNVSGAFKSDVFQLKSRGANNVENTLSGIGSTATIFIGSDFSLIFLNGKLLGQRVSD
jgi:hypothetical protein